MNSRRRIFFSSFFKYTLSLAVAALLFWWVYRDFNFSELFLRFKEVNLYFILLSVLLGLLSYYLRAFRWTLLLKPVGYKLATPRAFMALMVGYFANLLLPRMGEVSRCLVLKKTDNVEVSTSLGSVVAERSVDMATLLLVMAAGVFIEYDKLGNLLISTLQKQYSGLVIEPNFLLLLAVGLVFCVVLAFLLFIYLKRRFQRHFFFIKIRKVIREIIEGVMSLKKLDQPLGFWASTVAIWLLYFFMSYVVFFSFPPTMGLGVRAGISVLIMGGLGMATPVQGGVGPFHLFVSGVLLLYGIGREDGVFFAFLIHTSQFLIMLVVGIVSFIASLIVSKRNSYVGQK